MPVLTSGRFRKIVQDFKITSSAVALDWLIRQGLVTVDQEPDLPEVVELLHLPLHNMYMKNVGGDKQEY